MNNITTFTGRCIFGVTDINDIKEIRGCPEGRRRVRQRPEDFAKLYVYNPLTRNIRGFYITQDEDGGHSVGPELGRNITMPSPWGDEGDKEDAGDGWEASLESHGVVVS